MMSCIDVDADDSAIWARMKTCSHLAKTLCQDRIGTAMEESEGLGITFNWHASDETLRRSLKEFNSHLLIQGSTATLTNNFKIVGHEGKSN